MEAFVKISLISTSLFLVLNHDCVIYSDLLLLQLMTSQISSHMDYLIPTYNIRLIILYSKLMKSLASLAAFNTI